MWKRKNVAKQDCGAKIRRRGKNMDVAWQECGAARMWRSKNVAGQECAAIRMWCKNVTLSGMWSDRMCDKNVAPATCCATLLGGAARM
jgi:hypothetical protein